MMSEKPFLNVTTQSVADKEAQLHQRYGLPVHVHWYQFSDVIENVNHWLLYAVGAYITLVSVAGVVGGATVVVVTLRYLVTLFRKSSARFLTALRVVCCSNQLKLKTNYD
jgi:hypothetical protein